MNDYEKGHAEQAARILELEKQLTVTSKLAAAGLAFEVCGHDLVAQKWAIDDAYKRHDYETAKQIMDSVFSALEFVQPLRISGPHCRDHISGKRLQELVLALLRHKPYQQQVLFTDAALRTSVLAVTSRFVPAVHALIMNGLYWGAKATPPARVVVDAPEDGILTVADNGPGVSAADQVHLFQPLFSRRIAGNGIGLYLCRENLRLDNLAVNYVGGDAGAIFKITKLPQAA